MVLTDPYVVAGRIDQSSPAKGPDHLHVFDRQVEMPMLGQTLQLPSGRKPRADRGLQKMVRLRDQSRNVNTDRLIGTSLGIRHHRAHVRQACTPMVMEPDIQPDGLILHQPHCRLDPCLPEHRHPTTSHPDIGVVCRDHDSGHPGGHQSIGARRGSTGM